MHRRGFVLSALGALGALGAVALVGCADNPQNTPGTIDYEARFKSLGLALPEAPKAVANYVPYRRAGNLLYIAGQGPAFGQSEFLGTLGKDLTLEQGYAAARSAALNTLAQVRAALGSFNHVRQCLKLGGFVNSSDDFKDQPKVLNGASDMFVEVFGDAGRPARFAVGVNTLPFNVAVEIDSVWEVR